MSFLQFMSPLFLIFLLVIPIVAYFYFRSLKKKRDSAIKFSNIGLIKSAMGSKKHNVRKHLSFYLTLIIIGLVILGLSDPHIPLKQTKEGVNVVLAIDVSGSMQAQDYKPNRLESAKSSAKILLESLDSKDHAGIVIFGSGATTSAYLSPFKDNVIEKLGGIALRGGSTAIGDGLALAVDMASSIPNKKKTVILLSDGVSNSGIISPPEAIGYAKLNNIQVYTIGMGSETPVVLSYDFFGNPQYATLDEETLKMIAEHTGGKYFKSVDSKTLDEIYETIGSEIEREREPTSIKDWIFFIALIVLIAQLYIQHGRWRILQ